MSSKIYTPPIAIYGTSIAQGPCATILGMSCSNILGHRLNVPVINFGFSENGRLEKGVLVLINVVDASLYVLDCIPNFCFSEGDTPKKIEERLYVAIDQIKGQHSSPPILLVQHAGYTNGIFQTGRKRIYERLNKIIEKVFKPSLAMGADNNMHFMSIEEIGLTNNDFVDGTYPNDLGMFQYARTYENKANSILKTNFGRGQTKKWLNNF